MCDIRSDSVGPVIPQDLVIIGIREGDRVSALGSWGTGAIKLPLQPLLADIICYRSVLRLDVGCPSDVAHQITGLASEYFEVIGGYCELVMRVFLGLFIFLRTLFI